MSEQRKEVSFVCSSSSSFASVRGEAERPDGGRQPEVVGEQPATTSSSDLSSSFSLFGLPSVFDLVLSGAVEEVASCDGEESSFFEPEPVQGGAAY